MRLQEQVFKACPAVIRKYDLRPFELFDTWVQIFPALYDTCPKKKAKKGSSADSSILRISFPELMIPEEKVTD